MPAPNLQDVKELGRYLNRLLDASTPVASLAALRSLWVERLDFAPATGAVPLHKEGPPPTADVTAAIKRCASSTRCSRTICPTSWTIKWSTTGSTSFRYRIWVPMMQLEDALAAAKAAEESSQVNSNPWGYAYHIYDKAAPNRWE